MLRQKGWGQTDRVGENRQGGVSRTPVREAIRKLELEGLVIMLPRKGAYVASISKKDLFDILEVRVGLEGNLML